MTGFEADTDELDLTSSGLHHVVEGLQADIGRLQSEVAALLSGGWRGPAAGGFGQGWADWRDGADKALAALTAIATLLADGSQEYVATDQRLSSAAADLPTATPS
jgi:WXG100 family type VII secretion target